jgi:hypothetical protein
MQRQWMKEQMKKGIFAAMMSNPQVMQQAVSAVLGQPAAPAQADPTPPTSQDGNAMPADPSQDGNMHAGQPVPSPEEMAAMMGGEGGMQPGMERAPLTDSLPLPGERMA